jgi:hypothetical protein
MPDVRAGPRRPSASRVTAIVVLLEGRSTCSGEVQRAQVLDGDVGGARARREVSGGVREHDLVEAGGHLGPADPAGGLVAGVEVGQERGARGLLAAGRAGQARADQREARAVVGDRDAHHVVDDLAAAEPGDVVAGEQAALRVADERHPRGAGRLAHTAYVGAQLARGRGDLLGPLLAVLQRPHAPARLGERRGHPLPAVAAIAERAVHEDHRRPVLRGRPAGPVVGARRVRVEDRRARGGGRRRERDQRAGQDGDEESPRPAQHDGRKSFRAGPGRVSASSVQAMAARFVGIRRCSVRSPGQESWMVVFVVRGPARR